MRRKTCLVLFAMLMVMLTGCTGGTAYSENEEKDKIEIPHNNEEKDDETIDSSGNKELPTNQTGDFMTVENKSYDKNRMHRTCVISFATNDSYACLEKWEQIVKLSSCERAIKLYVNRNVKIDIPLENVNPEYLELYKKVSSEVGYSNLVEKGFLDEYIVMYSYDGCEDVLLTQSTGNIERKNIDPRGTFDYVGGFITNLQVGSSVSGMIENPLFADKNIPFEISFDRLSTAPEWFLDVAYFQICLSVPYNDYFNLYEGKETDAWYVVKAKTGRENEMREEINKILGSSGSVIEDVYYD